MLLFGFFCFMFFVAVILALWEIQIEGKNGWASKLPCWRIEKGLVVKIMGGRPLTGYHFFMIVFLITIIHFPFFFVAWSWRGECFVMGFLFAMLMIEDFFWFVLNPAYGIKSFRKGRIPWHKHWLGPIPDFFLYYGIAAGVLIWLGHSALNQ